MTIYSHSKLSCFEQCQRKYKFQYIDKIRIEIRESIELFLGKRVYETLKKLYNDLQYKKKNNLEDLLVFLCNQWGRNWNNSIVIVKKQYEQDDYLNIAERCVTDYYNRCKPFDRGRTIALEERVLINLNGYKLLGYIDRLVEAEDGCYEIHDYKTCSRLPSLKYIQNDRQLALYSIEVKERYPDVKDVRLIWHFLKFDRDIDSICTDGKLEEVKQNAIELINTIENAEKFPANPSRLCNWCKFKPMCMQ